MYLKHPWKFCRNSVSGNSFLLSPVYYQLFFRYEFTNRYAIEHYKENTVIRNEEFYNFTKKIDDLMHKKILNVTKVDITNTSVDSTELLGELYRNGSVTSEQVCSSMIRFHKSQGRR